MYVHKCRSSFIAMMTLYGSILCPASQSERQSLEESARRRSERQRERTNYGGAREQEKRLERERERASADSAARERTRKSEHARANTHMLEDIEGECTSRAVVVCESAHQAKQERARVRVKQLVSRIGPPTVCAREIHTRRHQQKRTHTCDVCVSDLVGGARNHFKARSHLVGHC